MTQLERARRARHKLRVLFVQIALAKDELASVLNEAQNSPPEGLSDGSIPGWSWNRFDGVRRGAEKLLASLLSDPELL